MTRKGHAGLPELTSPHLNGHFDGMFPNLAYCVPSWRFYNIQSLRGSMMAIDPAESKVPQNGFQAPLAAMDAVRLTRKSHHPADLVQGRPALRAEG